MEKEIVETKRQATANERLGEITSVEEENIENYQDEEVVIG